MVTPIMQNPLDCGGATNPTLSWVPPGV